MYTFQELIKRYLPKIEEDLYYIPKNSKRTLMSIMVLTASGWSDSFTDDDIQKSYKVIDLLLRNGFDINHKDQLGESGQSPLELAKELQDDGYGKVYDYLMNKQLSAVEAPQVLNKIGSALRKVAGLPKKVLETQGKALSGLAGLAYDHSKEHKKYLEDQEKYYKPANQSQKVDDPTEENLNEGIKDLEGASKQRYIIQNLPTNIKNNLKGEGLNKVVSKLSNTNQPYSSDFWKSLEAIGKLNSNGLVDFAFNGKFADFFIDLFERTKASGLTGENQLRTLAFFKLHNFPIEGNLVSGNNIKSIQEMGKFVNNNITKDPKTGEFLFKAKANTPQDKNGRELLNSYLKKPVDSELSLSEVIDIYLEKNPKANRSQVSNILSQNKPKLTGLMNKTYKKTFSGDKPILELVSDIEKIVKDDLKKLADQKNSEINKGLTGRELLNSKIKKSPEDKLSLADIAKVYNTKNPDLDSKVILEILKKNKSKLASLMDKPYKRVFKGDNPFDDLLSDIGDIINKEVNRSGVDENNGLNKEQQDAVDALMSLKLKKKEATDLIKSIDDYSNESDLIVKALRKMGKK